MEILENKQIHRVKNWILNKLLRSRVKHVNKELKRSMEFFPESITAFEIVKIQSRKSTSDIVYAPVSGEFYITNGEKYIILKNNSVSIVNGVYHYYVDMSSESMKYLDKYLKRIVERRRSKIKKRMETNIIRSLTDILDNLKNEQTVI